MNQCCAIDPKKSSPSDAAEIFARLEEERVIAASERLDDQRFQTSFLVPDMHCAGCIGTIERGLLSMPQVESVRANLTTRRVAVCWTKGSKHGTEILNFLHFVVKIMIKPVTFTFSSWSLASAFCITATIFYLLVRYRVLTSYRHAFIIVCLILSLAVFPLPRRPRISIPLICM